MDLENPTFELGSYHHRRSDSHAYSPNSPSTTLETQCAEELFQRPPHRPSLPPTRSQGPHSAPRVDSARHFWQTSQHSAYRVGEHEPPPNSDYEFIEGPEAAQNTESSASTFQTWDHLAEKRGSGLCSDPRREEHELFVPSSRQSRPVPGVFGHVPTLMSSDYSHSTGFSDLPTLAQVAAGASVASSSRLPSPSTSRSGHLATGSYSGFSILDTPVDTADLGQCTDPGLSGNKTSLDVEPSQAFGSRTSGGSSSGGPARTKKQRSGKGRERRRIELAPDQPPTTQGKQRERVYVACQQCRSRKIRCDGAKPMCFNCTQRGTGICEFDTIPKRRGPDRQPGARQRHGKELGPRVRRRSAKSEKQESPPDVQANAYLTLHSDGSFPDIPTTGTGNQNATWARIPSPPSTTSTNGFNYDYEHPGSGSAGSDTSQAPHEYYNVHAHPFAYSAPQDGYVDTAIRPETHSPNPRDPVLHISTDSVVQSSAAPLSGSFSPETSAPIQYSIFTNPFGSQASPHANAPPGLMTGVNNGTIDSMATLDCTASPDSVGFGDHVPCGLSFEQPIVVNHEPVVPASYTNYDISAIHHQGGNDYLTVPETCPANIRRDSFNSVNSDLYNPYQWAVHREQNSPAAYISQSEDEVTVPYGYNIIQPPSLDFVRKTWWDSLLDTYCSEPYCTPAVAARYESVYGLSVTIPHDAYSVGTVRQQVAQIIVRDLQSIFKDSIFWFAFINVPLFFGTFFRTRESMQPALVLALLMFSNYLRCSTLELGLEGMRRTEWLRDKAQAALDASVSAAWIDPGLAQAAWLLALFELSSHPNRSVSRLHSSLTTLDNIIRALALTFIDAEDQGNPSLADSISSSLRQAVHSNNGSVSHILPVPLYNRRPIAGAGIRHKRRNSSQLLQYHSQSRGLDDLHQHVPTIARSLSEREPCVCNELSLGRNWSEAKDHVPFWLNAPAWKSTWSDMEVRREESRRLCWNTLHLFAGYTTYRTSLELNLLDLFLLHPSNVHNIFPGENLTDLSRKPTTSAKHETVWALYARAILLWHACLRIRNVSDRERAIFAQSVWLEADAIENALDGHTCNTERSFLYHGREYLFNARMYVSSEFRRFVPHPSPNMSGVAHRRKAEEWLTHQATVAKQSMQSLPALTGVRGTLLAKRPFFCFWFMGHISRCLQLWKADKSLMVALELAKNFVTPINYLSALWPCEDQWMQYTGIRKQLDEACREAGVAPPAPIDYSSLTSNFTNLL